MRILEKEGFQGVYILIILLVLSLYFNMYIASIFIVLFFIYWFYIFSYKTINPVYPDGIISPVSGQIKKIESGSNFTKILIKIGSNARIYSPADFKVTKITKQKGFYFLKNSSMSEKFGAKEIIDGKLIINDCSFDISMIIKPLIFKCCAFDLLNNDVLFLEKVGFINFGCLEINLNYSNVDNFTKNLLLNVKEGQKITGGVTNLFNKISS